MQKKICHLGRVSKRLDTKSKLVDELKEELTEKDRRLGAALQEVWPRLTLVSSTPNHDDALHAGGAVEQPHLRTRRRD